MGFLEGLKMGFDLLWSILTAEPLFTIALVGFIVVTLLLLFVVNFINQQKLRKSGILEVDKMPGRKFEEYLQLLLKARGYHAQLTPASGDYGADLVLSTKEKKIIVQAKRYKKNVGVKAIQEIAAAKNHYNANECWVVTNSYFTEQAKKLAHSNKVRLINRDMLMSWMLKENRDEQVKKGSS